MNRRAEIVSEIRTRNGQLIEQSVRTDDNNSLYVLHGVDMLDEPNAVGRSVIIRPINNKTARLVKS